MKKEYACINDRTLGAKFCCGVLVEVNVKPRSTKIKVWHMYVVVLSNNNIS